MISRCPWIVGILLLSFALGAAIPGHKELLERANSKDESERLLAIEWLGLLKVKDGTPLLLKRLEALGSTVWQERIEIILALGRIGDPVCIVPLLKCQLPELNSSIEEILEENLKRIDPGWRLRPEVLGLFDGYQKDLRGKVFLDRKRAVPKCLEALSCKDCDDDLWVAAANLVELREKAAFLPILDLFFNPEKGNQWYMARYLEQIEPGWRESVQVRERLAPWLEGFSQKVKEYAGKMEGDESRYREYLWAGMDVLNHLRSSQAVPFLLDVLHDSALDQSLRISAIQTLGETRDRRAHEPLLALVLGQKDPVEDSEQRMVAECIEALGKIGDHQDVPVLAKMVEHRYFSQAALGALEEMKAVEALPGLMAIAGREMKEKESNLLGRVLVACKNIGDRSLMPELWAMADRALALRPKVSRANLQDLIQCITWFEDPGSAERLLDWLVHFQERLATGGGKGGIPSEQDNGLKKVLIRALALAREKRALPVIKAHLRDPDPALRAYAEWAVYEITR